MSKILLIVTEEENGTLMTHTLTAEDSLGNPIWERETLPFGVHRPFQVHDTTYVSVDTTEVKQEEAKEK